MTEKHGSPIESLGDDKKSEGVEDSRIQGVGEAKGSRIQGFKWRKIEGWRVGCLAKNQRNPKNQRNQTEG